MIGWYCGIDQSLGGYGIAFFAPTERPRLFHKAFSAQKYGAGVDRLLHVGAWVLSVLQDLGTDRIVHVTMEGYARGAKFRREESGEISLITRLTLHQYLPYNGIGYPTLVAPMQRAKYATGKGGADKKQVMAAIKREWGESITNDNEADAYVLARIAWDLHRGNHPKIIRPKHQQEILDGLTPHTEAPKPSQQYAWSRLRVT